MLNDDGTAAAAPSDKEMDAREAWQERCIRQEMAMSEPKAAPRVLALLSVSPVLWTLVPHAGLLLSVAMAKRTRPFCCSSLFLGLPLTLYLIECCTAHCDLQFSDLC